MDGGGQDKWKHTRSLGTSLHLLRVRSCDGPRVGDRAVNKPSRSLSSAHKYSKQAFTVHRHEIGMPTQRS